MYTYIHTHTHTHVQTATGPTRVFGWWFYVSVAPSRRRTHACAPACMYARTHACMRARTRARLHTYIRAYPHKRAESMHTIADTPAHGPPCRLRRRLQPCATAEACAPIPTRRTDHDHAGRESAAAMPRRRSRAVSCATGAGGRT